MLEGLNFKEFIALLSAFSARATKDDKLKCESFNQHFFVWTFNLVISLIPTQDSRTMSTVLHEFMSSMSD